jgi:hypothetical protein
MKSAKLIAFFLLLFQVFFLAVACQPSPIECTQFTEEDAGWADNQLSPDYHHLDASFSETLFDFSGTDLEALIDYNSFSVSEGQDEVLFGLRGCRIIEDSTPGFTGSVTLQETIPNHIDYRDVLGVWRQSTGEISVFEGSTVPNWYYMCIQVEIGGHESNMLPTGRYIYQVDTHRDIEGVFRSEQEVVVLRSNDDLVYETTDDWEEWVPLDNIHPGGCPGEMYSSAGCQTIPGTFGTGCEGFYTEETDTHLGTWGSFRSSAGLDPENNRDRWEEQYIYILLTCREARLTSQGEDPESLIRLRFGSIGENVLQLQVALLELGYNPGPLDGIMGPKTVSALIEWQRSIQNGQADGILTPVMANILGFELE